MKRNIPEKTVQRLLLYYRYLNLLLQQGARNISSKSLADLMEIRASQVRKDLSYFGRLGKRGAGYDVLALRDKIAVILRIEKEIRACVVGMGSLGSALSTYKGFETLGFKVSAIFDNSKKKIGHKIRGKVCHDVKNLARVIRLNNIQIALLTVPAEAAQEIALRLEKANIKAILNFTPVKLTLSQRTKISNVDLAQELKTLSFFMRA